MDKCNLLVLFIFFINQSFFPKVRYNAMSLTQDCPPLVLISSVDEMQCVVFGYSLNTDIIVAFKQNGDALF